MESFDWKIYLANYHDLRNAGINTQSKAIKHWNTFGKSEGRTDTLLTFYQTSYQVKGYSDLLKETNKHANKVPKIIFKTSPFTRENMNTEMIRVLENLKKLNPDYNVYYFDDTEVEQSLKDLGYLDIYLILIPGAFRADFWRYIMLEKYGGCYSDIGHDILVPLDQIIENASLVLTQEVYQGIHNGFMCCKPGCEFMKDAKNACIKNIKNRDYGTIDTDITGPVMLSKIKINEPVKWLTHKVNVIPELYRITFKNKTIINTKFSNYNFIMYDSKENYHILWNLNKVFK